MLTTKAVCLRLWAEVKVLALSWSYSIRQHVRPCQRLMRLLHDTNNALYVYGRFIHKLNGLCAITYRIVLICYTWYVGKLYLSVCGNTILWRLLLLYLVTCWKCRPLSACVICMSLCMCHIWWCLCTTLCYQIGQLPLLLYPLPVSEFRTSQEAEIFFKNVPSV